MNLLGVVGVAAILAIVILVITMSPSKRTPVESRAPEVPAAPMVYEFKKQGELRFQNSKKGMIAVIDIEVAREESRREQGLMYRERMGDNQGMLFIFDGEAPRSFWMKNTILSLDMLFINAKNEIVTIHKYTTPYSEESYISTKPAQYVLEVVAGFTDKRGIVVGDQIVWSMF